MNTPDRFILDLKASCACKAVDVRLHGPVLSMLMCACLDCQRTSGSGHADVVIVHAGSTRTEGNLNSYTRPSDSGAQFTRHFCPRCGSPVFGQSSRAPNLRMLPVGLFAGHNDWFAPSQLIFARSRAAWELFADHLPQHQTYRENGQP